MPYSKFIFGIAWSYRWCKSTGNWSFRAAPLYASNCFRLKQLNICRLRYPLDVSPSIISLSFTFGVLIQILWTCRRTVVCPQHQRRDENCVKWGMSIFPNVVFYVNSCFHMAYKKSMRMTNGFFFKRTCFWWNEYFLVNICLFNS